MVKPVKPVHQYFQILLQLCSQYERPEIRLRILYQNDKGDCEVLGPMMSPEGKYMNIDVRCSLELDYDVLMEELEVAFQQNDSALQDFVFMGLTKGRIGPSLTVNETNLEMGSF